MGWWWGYQVTRGFGDWVQRELAPARDPGEGYILPDERARQRACALLAADASVDSSAVQVSVLSGELRLSGSVPTLEMKIRAERICAAVPGVAKVDNALIMK